MSAVERSQNLRVQRMHPILQFMAGPLLRYDTVDADGVWHGAAMIVSTSARISCSRCGAHSRSCGRRLGVRAVP